MDLSTRASRLLHKFRENDTIRVLYTTCYCVVRQKGFWSVDL